MRSADEPFIDRIQTLMSARTAAMIGAVGAIVTVESAQLTTVGLTLGCISVVLLYAVYPLGSLAWGSARERLVEWSYLVVGTAALALAIADDPRWLAVGWGAHGAWDLLHRQGPKIGLKAIPPWYLDACVVWDLLAAVGLAIAL